MDFAHLFGIRPWEWGQLLYTDTVRLMSAVDHYRAEIEARNRET